MRFFKCVAEVFIVLYVVSCFGEFLCPLCVFVFLDGLRDFFVESVGISRCGIILVDVVALCYETADVCWECKMLYFPRGMWS